MSILEQNTLALQTILEKVNSLPDAGDGGSDSTVVTGTFTPATTQEFNVTHNLGKIPKWLVIEGPSTTPLADDVVVCGCFCLSVVDGIQRYYSYNSYTKLLTSTTASRKYAIALDTEVPSDLYWTANTVTIPTGQKLAADTTYTWYAGV